MKGLGCDEASVAAASLYY